MTSSHDLRYRLERLQRLRRLGVRRGPQGMARPATRVAVVEDVDPVLPGGPVETPHGAAWLRTVHYPLAQWPGLAEWSGISPYTLAALDRNESLLGLEPSRAAFIDTETTGLSLSASTYTFLIGIGTYEPGAFVVRQYFMRNPAEERGQLHLVEEALAASAGIVSFNGRGFDMPLVANRFILAGMAPPLPGAPHLDLLPPARRLYKARWGSCSLGNLERNVLGIERTGEDVPGYLIPDIYRQYYLTGVATEMLARVFYHNLQDIVSMALLAVQMARYFDMATLNDHLSTLHPLECLSLGRCYDTLNWSDACILTYRSALSRLNGSAEQAQAWRELGFVYKRLERRTEAAALWEEWISTVPGDDLTPFVELAKHHEWHTGDLDAARGWAAWALKIAEGWPPGMMRDQAVAELQHRLARIEAKRAGRMSGTTGDEAQQEEDTG
jgi:uncharacterized protein